MKVRCSSSNDVQATAIATIMTNTTLDERLSLLSSKGVEIVDPRQVYVDEFVDLHRIFPGSTLFPGTRISGCSTVIAPEAKIGTEGPATIDNSAIGRGAEIASGYLTRAVLLDRSRIGSNGHIRAGTLLEEEASTAHAVGLKHTILMSFVTLGSLINCCDCLVSGGRSRSNHTEVGSGFIHFNFTPWGETGDKATPSLIGGVPLGVFLREQRIFIGGSGGMVGPNRVGFGSFTVAGQIIRSDVAERRIHSEVARVIDAPWDFHARRPSELRIEINLEYIGHLVALHAWYSLVRRRRLPADHATSHTGMVVEAAITLIEDSIAERWTRLQHFVGQNNPLAPIQFPDVPCPLSVSQSSQPHIEWVRNLPDAELKVGIDWLKEIVATFISINGLERSTAQALR
jgi:hypothetical protein